MVVAEQSITVLREMTEERFVAEMDAHGYQLIRKTKDMLHFHNAELGKYKSFPIKLVAACARSILYDLD